MISEDNFQDNKLQMLGKLTASLIHEIRNPLSAIKMNLDYLKLIESELPGEANESIEYCLDALSRIQYLVDNVMTFSRKNVGGKKICSLNEITQDAISLMHSHAERRKIIIQTELESELPEGNFDKSKLLQVFLNLITNSIESCNGNGLIKISTFKNKDGYIMWEISDNGVGIREEDRNKIFNDFYTNKEKGTGLGLSVCKMLLEEHGAHMDFESTHGKGTKFFIRFNSTLTQGNNEL